MRRFLASAGLAVVATLAASPALGQQKDLTLIAMLAAGLADGGEVLIGALGKGKVSVVGEGVYDVVLPAGTAHFLFDAPDTCRFTMHTQMDGQGTSEGRFDLTVATGIEVRDQGEWEGLKAALVTIQGPPNTMEVYVNETWQGQMAVAFLASSITVEELQAAADELMRIC